MKLLEQHASDLLFEKARSIEGNHGSWRCIYISLADKRDQYAPALRTYFFVQPILNMLASEDGYIYLCHDGDIVILFQGALKPIADKLSQHFGDLDPGQEWEHPGETLFTVFDLSQTWNIFFELCSNKAVEEAYAHVHTPAYLPRTRRAALMAEQH